MRISDRGMRRDNDGAAEMARLYTQDGLTLAEIGDRFGINYETVRRRLIKTGVSRRRRGPRSGSRWHADIVLLQAGLVQVRRNRGETFRAIARALNLGSRQRAHQLYRIAEESS